MPSPAHIILHFWLCAHSMHMTLHTVVWCKQVDKKKMDKVIFQKPELQQTRQSTLFLTLCCVRMQQMIRDVAVLQPRRIHENVNKPMLSMCMRYVEIGQALLLWCGVAPLMLINGRLQWWAYICWGQSTWTRCFWMMASSYLHYMSTLMSPALDMRWFLFPGILSYHAFEIKIKARNWWKCLQSCRMYVSLLINFTSMSFDLVSEPILAHCMRCDKIDYIPKREGGHAPDNVLTSQTLLAWLDTGGVHLSNIRLNFSLPRRPL